MASVVYLHGKFYDPASAQISFLDRGYLFGDSAFETVRSYGGKPFRLERHLDRLAHSCNVLGITIPATRKEIVALVHETLTHAAEKDAYIRITISRGEGGAGISTKGCNSHTFSILVRPLVSYPREAYEQGIRSMVVATRRIPAACLDPSIKCGNYLPSIMARRELDAQSLLEGVQLSVEGYIVSGTVSNVFIVQDRQLRTPDLASGCLPGVTRGTVLEFAEEAGFHPVEDLIELSDLLQAEEMFFTNTLMELLPVAQLNSHRFVGGAPGPKTRSLQHAWNTLVRKETDTYMPHIPASNH